MTVGELLGAIEPQLITGLIVTLYVFFDLLNKLSESRLKAKQLSLRERQELLDRIDSLESELSNRMVEIENHLSLIAELRPVAAKVPILEAQVQELLEERKRLISDQVKVTNNNQTIGEKETNSKSD